MVRITRLKNKNTIKKLLLKGFIYKTKKYKIYFNFDSQDFSYAISVSKKLGKAYLRNREKRWIRSIFYQNKALFNKGGYAFIVIKESGGIYLDASNQIVSFINNNFK